MSYFNEYPYRNITDLNLDYLINTMQTLSTSVETLESWKETFEDELGTFTEFIEQLEAGEVPDSVATGVQTWLTENAIDLIGNLIDLVIFNITDDGYFVAYIPESWDEIEFGTTGLDTTSDTVTEYGHLVLSYTASTTV